MSDGDELSSREKELIAVGAAIAAGCQPCTTYHVRAAATAGATAYELRQAVADALEVRHGATEGMRDWAGGLIGDAPAEPGTDYEPKPRLCELISVAAAVAVNSETHVARHVAAARATGATVRQVQVAVGLARAIRGVAERHADEAVREALGETPGEESAAESPCGCGATPAPTAGSADCGG
jgi:AhpD family alkylhydroperoxidase